MRRLHEHARQTTTPVQLVRVRVRVRVQEQGPEVGRLDTRLPPHATCAHGRAWGSCQQLP